MRECPYKSGAVAEPDATTGCNSPSTRTPPPFRFPQPSAATMARSPSAANTPTRAAFPSQPTDLDLVNTYLRPWVETGVKAAPFIHQADVYAADPADLTRQFTPAVAQDGERAWYFYTSLRHKSVRGKRKARSVASGTGCWHNEAKSKPVYTGINGKRQIGYRQSFSFVKKYGTVRIRTGWLMIELRLRKDCAGQEAKEEGSLEALCKVYRSPRNPEDRDASGNPEDRDAVNPERRDAAPAAELPARNAEAADDDESRPRGADHVAPLPGRKAEADGHDAESGSATESNDGGRKSDEEISSEATAAPSRHSQAERGIFGAAAAARIEKASGCEDSAVASAAAPTLKRKLSEDGSSGAPAPARKKADGSTSPGEAAPTTEMHCPHCGTHLIVTMKRPETEAAKDAVGAANTTAPTRFHEWL
ncbi:hypothetical protein BS78_03G229300 [Paspalum vaginatum]|nr:hypothetical protein BS78_03G229300 [Paspalum vaginatum]